MADREYDRPTYTSDFIKSDTDKAVFLGDVVIDNMMTAMIALGAEVWSNRRRMKVLESLLEEKGVTNAMVEAYMPSEEQSAEWMADRDAFVKRTFGVLAREGDLKMSSDWQNSDP